jgi:hypothetical protein
MSGAVIRHMLGRGARGRIVNIASVAGKARYPERAASCASKFAVIGREEQAEPRPVLPGRRPGDWMLGVLKVCPVQRYGLGAVLSEYQRSGRILGKDSDELEGYRWPLDGRHYGPGTRPALDATFFDVPGFGALGGDSWRSAACNPATDNPLM